MFTFDDNDLFAILSDPKIQDSQEAENIQKLLACPDTLKSRPSGFYYCSSQGHKTALAQGTKLSGIYTVSKNNSEANKGSNEDLDKGAERLEKEERCVYEKGFMSSSDMLKMRMLRELDRTDWMYKSFSLDSSKE